MVQQGSSYNAGKQSFSVLTQTCAGLKIRQSLLGPQRYILPSQSFHHVNYLPSIHFKASFIKVSCDNCSLRELSASERLQSCLCCCRVDIFQEDFPYTVRLSATTHGSRDLHIKNLTIFLTLLLDILTDF